jgi:hypothetical protein
MIRGIIYVLSMMIAMVISVIIGLMAYDYMKLLPKPKTETLS